MTFLGRWARWSSERRGLVCWQGFSSGPWYLKYEAPIRKLIDISRSTMGETQTACPRVIISRLQVVITYITFYISLCKLPRAFSNHMRRSTLHEAGRTPTLVDAPFCDLWKRVQRRPQLYRSIRRRFFVLGPAPTQMPCGGTDEGPMFTYMLQPCHISITLSMSTFVTSQPMFYFRNHASFADSAYGPTCIDFAPLRPSSSRQARWLS